MVEWYNLLIPETRAYILETSFKPIIGLISEKSARTTLVQCLIECWWDTTHTVHIAKQEMTMTPYDFYRMTSLRFEKAIINLDGVLGIKLCLDMLGRKYSTKTTQPFEGAGLRALYLAKRVQCQLVGRVNPLIPMDLSEFILASHSMTDAEYHS